MAGIATCTYVYCSKFGLKRRRHKIAFLLHIFPLTSEQHRRFGMLTREYRLRPRDNSNAYIHVWAWQNSKRNHWIIIMKYRQSLVLYLYCGGFYTITHVYTIISQARLIYLNYKTLIIIVIFITINIFCCCNQIIIINIYRKS